MGSVALRVPTVCGRLEDGRDWGAKYRNAFWDTVNSLADRGYRFCLLSAVFFCAIRCDVVFLSVYSHTVRRNALRIHNHTSEGSVAINQVSKFGLTGLQRPKSTWTWVLKPGPSPLSSSCSLASPVLGCHIRWWVCWRCSVDASTSARPFYLPHQHRGAVVELPSRQSSTRWYIAGESASFVKPAWVHSPRPVISVPRFPGRSRRRIRPQQHLCVQQWDPVFCLGFAPKYETFEVMVSKNTYELKTWQITPPIIICSDEGNSICCLKFIKAIFIYVPECGICLFYFFCVGRILQVLQFCKTWNIGK